MPKPFLELTLEQFDDLLQQFPWRRQISEVHVHHTFKPNHADFASRPPIQSIEGMFRFHTEDRNFSDIAQHITIDPRGIIWTGRNWNQPPASATGFNGNANQGPFMFETIGNFDTGSDPFAGEQRRVVIEVIARVQHRFGLGPEAFRFHREMSPKSCPGTSLHKEEILTAVREVHGRLAAPVEPGAGAFDLRASELRATTERSISMLNVDPGARSLVNETELDEGEMDSSQAALSAGDVDAVGRLDRARVSRGLDLSADDLDFLRSHVVNLRLGAFSAGGVFQTSPEDVEALFNEHLQRALDLRVGQGRKLKLVFFAHGGLNDEATGLKNALHRIQFYLENQCYPVFFVWETGPKETLVDILRGIIGLGPARGFLDPLVNRIVDFSDAGLESVFRPAGFSMWANMKRSAELAFLPKQGGTFLTERLVAFWKQHHANMEIHAIGHSAGSIFHAHFLDLLCHQQVTPKVEIKSLHLLAPAVSIDLFKEKLMPLVGQQLQSLTEFTMHKDFELADSVGPYRKSLLYLVSRSFEDEREMPILGLEESIRRDADMIRFFGLAGNKKPKGEILFSVQQAGPRNSTVSRRHGDFDNDRPTMAGVIRRILEVPDSQSIVEFPEMVSRTVLDMAVASPPSPPVVPAFGPAKLLSAVSGSRRALCVGIDEYPAPNQLGGCVNDALDWKAALESLGFQTWLIRNKEATRQTIQDRLGEMVRSASAGDVLVFQYAGHGTLLDDLDGDEKSGKDSALCPVDFTSGGFIIDDDLRALFQVLPDGVNLTCFFDCCHSGTITRLVGPTPARVGRFRSRFIRATPEMEETHRRFRAAQGLRATVGRNVSSMKEISLTACTDAQVALEFDGHGQFTARALGIFREGIQGLSNEQFHQNVVAAFGGSAGEQTPQLDCAISSRGLGFLAALTASSATDSLTGATREALLTRLDHIEQRLSRLGG